MDLQGSVFSAIGSAINTVISAIAGAIMAIVGGVTMLISFATSSAADAAVLVAGVGQEGAGGVDLGYTDKRLALAAVVLVFPSLVDLQHDLTTRTN
ncbi:hypothetical protein BU15DRAFT_71461 [Melanogaster broomeanus]|nr:hypothetical protein BU15DRAFT_71461 [Melanogaster broomeanus]